MVEVLGGEWEEPVYQIFHSSKSKPYSAFIILYFIEFYKFDYFSQFLNKSKSDWRVCFLILLTHTRGLWPLLGPPGIPLGLLMEDEDPFIEIPAFSFRS